MNKRFLISLIVAVVIISLGAAWAVYYKTQDEGSLSKGEVVLPGLREQLANVDHVQMTAAGAPPFNLQYTGTEWVVKERNNYPANFSKIRTMLEQLGSAKFYEPKTSSPENYSVLGVADITDKNSPGVLTEVFVKNKPEPYRLLVGKLANTWDGSYARLPQQAQSWLLDRQIPVDNFVTAWLSNVVLAIEPVRVYKVTYTTPNNEQLVVIKNDRNSKRFAVDNLPAGKTLRYDTIVDGVARDFENIILRDVQLASSFSFVPSETYTAQIETYDGLVVNIQTQKTDNRYYLALQSHYDADTANKMGATAADIVNQAKTDADTIQKRAAGWAYEINEYVYLNLTKTMKDVLPETADKNSDANKPVEDAHDH